MPTSMQGINFRYYSLAEDSEGSGAVGLSRRVFIPGSRAVFTKSGKTYFATTPEGIVPRSDESGSHHK
jgi:hypothetical protein